jgi:hypothetical protein
VVAPHDLGRAALTEESIAVEAFSVTSPRRGRGYGLTAGLEGAYDRRARDGDREVGGRRKRESTHTIDSKPVLQAMPPTG